MSIEDFKSKLENTPTVIEFSETISVIEAYYDFTATSFSNGSLENNLEENTGSCKLFAFAKKQALTKDQTLACFGNYYFDDVLKNPNGNSHQNIRNFMKTGFEELIFKGEPLKEK